MAENPEGYQKVNWTALYHWAIAANKQSGTRRGRTFDAWLFRPTLYQLSYGSIHTNSYQVNPSRVELETSTLRESCSANWAMDSWFGMKESNLRQPGQSRSLYHWANPESHSLTRPKLPHQEKTVKRFLLAGVIGRIRTCTWRMCSGFIMVFRPYPLHRLRNKLACVSTPFEKGVLFKVRSFISHLSPFSQIGPDITRIRGGYPLSFHTPCILKTNKCFRCFGVTTKELPYDYHSNQKKPERPQGELNSCMQIDNLLSYHWTMRAKTNVCSWSWTTHSGFVAQRSYPTASTDIFKLLIPMRIELIFLDWKSSVLTTGRWDRIHTLLLSRYDGNWTHPMSPEYPCKVQPSQTDLAP